MRSLQIIRMRLGRYLTCALLAFGLSHHAPAVASARSLVVQDPEKSDSPRVESSLLRTLDQLKTEVERLRQAAALEKNRKQESVKTLITAEEEQAEALQQRLLEVVEKETVLQSRLIVVEQQLAPENIDRMLAGYGSTRPEEVRETLRRRLSTEKEGIQVQLDLLRQQRDRLKASLARGEESMQRL